jgi:T5SS/PEP-CTERM-associated repeat protein
MSRTFRFVNADGSGNLDHSGNWIDETSPTIPGPPGGTDTALVEAAGNINGFASIETLLLDGVGGLLTSTAQIYTTTLQLTGDVALSGESYSSIAGTVQQSGTSTATLEDGSYLYVENGNVSGTTSFGMALLKGEDSNFNLSGFGTQVYLADGNAIIGASGIGAMTVSAGADLSEASNTGEITLGSAAGGQGALTVTGQSSELMDDGELSVGGGGKGALSILAGGEASINLQDSGLGLLVGGLAGSSGSVLVSGAGSRLTNTYDASYSIIGDAGAGSLTIASAGFAELGSLDVGYAGGTGSVSAEGAGTMLEIRGYLDLGSSATGSLQVTSGAQVIQDSYNGDVLGVTAGGRGSIAVSGAGSIFNAGADSLLVGLFGTGSVTVSAGGKILSSAANGETASVGAGSGSKGSVIIDGPGSSWTAVGGFDLGATGSGGLLVEAGGTLETGYYNGVAGLVVGRDEGSAGAATITGTGSTLTNSGEFVIGNSGSGTLTIASGGVVSTSAPSGTGTDGAVIGDALGSKGTVVVSGTGSRWTIGSDLVIGDGGSGSLAIGAGSTVSAASLAMAETATGSLDISGIGAKLSVSGNAVFGGSGQANVTIGAGGQVSAGGTIELKNGHLVLSGGSLSAKLLGLDARQLLSGDGTVVASSIINSATVQASGGTLSFMGSITGTGQVQIDAASTLSLGSGVSSGQEITFESATSKLALADPPAFAGTIAGFNKGDTIDLSKVVGISLTYSGDVLTVHESGGAVLALKFSGAYTQSSFGMTSDGHSGTFITHT